tara:strand:+ start:12765 stop:13703 length:939 start_codon:yes stop_codon:yes gene_type:complete
MQHFQPILIAIGILAIAGVLIHGFLLNRKNKLALLAEKDEQLDEQDKTTDIDDDVKISRFDRDFDSMAFSSHLAEEKEEPEEFNFTTDTKQNINQVDPVFFKSEHPIEAEVADIKLREQPEIDDIAYLSMADISNSEDMPSQTDLPSPADSSSPIDSSSPTDLPSPTESSSPIIETPVELFIFNIAAKNGERLGGHELLQFFLTSGFRYGDMNIFHRHEHSDGTGEVLFSIANMMAPGTFDLDYMEQFNSPGISFFFTAPNDKISVNKSFDMMLRAVEQLAEEFDCEVLDEKREKFTPQQFIEYRTRLAKYS